jgi:hypothetical protein
VAGVTEAATGASHMFSASSRAFSSAEVALLVGDGATLHKFKFRARFFQICYRLPCPSSRLFDLLEPWSVS